jgi:hypothetical protein
MMSSRHRAGPEKHDLSQIEGKELLSDQLIDVI